MRNYSTIALVIACTALSCASSTSLATRGEFLDAHFRTEDAGEKFRQAVRANDANPRALADLARWYMRQGESGLAEMLLARACLNPATTRALRGMKPAKKEVIAESWALYARVLYRNGKKQESERAFSQGFGYFPDSFALETTQKEIAREEEILRLRQELQRNPYNAALRRSLTELYFEAGWIHLVLAETKILIQAGAANASLLSRIVYALNEKGYSEYLPYWLEQLLRYEPRNAFALRRLAENALAREDLWQANTWFTSYLQAWPDDAAMQEEGGFLFLRVGKNIDGRRALERAYALGLRSQRLLNTLGHFALNQDNRQDRAEKYFEEARSCLPGGEDAEHKRTRLGLETQRLRQYADFFEYEPQRLQRVLTRIAENLLELGDFRQALEEANRVLDINPALVPAHIAKGRAELGLGRAEAAIRILHDAEKLDPRDALVSWFLAHAYADAGNNNAYIRHLKKASVKNPGELQYYLTLARHYCASDDHENALIWYTYAEKIQPTEENRAAIRQEKRSLIEQDLQSKEHSARRSSERLFALALEYEEKLGKSHAGYLRCLDAASRLKPGHAGLHILSGDAALSCFAGDPGYDFYLLAREHIGTALRLAPNNAFALRMRAAILQFDADMDTNVPLLVETLTHLDLDSSPLYYEDLLASLKGQDEARAARFYMIAKMLYNKSGDPAARHYLEKASTLTTRDAAGIMRALGAILRESGDYYGAIQAYEKLLANPNLSAQQDYAVVNLVLGNIAAEIARNAPFSLAAFRHCYPEATNAEAIFAALPKLASETKAALEKARNYYYGYIHRTGYVLHKTRVQNLVNSIASLSASTAEMAHRVAGMAADAGENVLAMDILSLALDTRPGARDSALLMNDLAALLAANGRTDEATEVWEKLVAQYPDDWLSRRAYAKHLLSQGELEKVIDSFEKALRRNPSESDVHTMLAFLYWRQGAVDKAIQSLEKSLQLQNSNLYALYYILKIELERGNTIKAVSYGERLISNFKKSMEKNYTDPEVRDMLLDTLGILARAAFRAGSSSRCLEYIYEGLELDTENRFAFLAMAGDVRILQQKYDEAEDFYARASRADPGNFVLRLKWAEACKFSGRTDEAIRILEKLYSEETLFTKRQEVVLLLSDLLAKQGLQKKAIAVLESLIHEQPYSEAGYIALANLYSDNNQTKNAQAALERGISHVRRTPALKDSLAWLLANTQPEELQRARQIALENVAAHPDNIDYRATLGYVLMQLGESAQAAKPLKLDETVKLARKRPPRPVMGSTIEAAMAYYQSNRFREALDAIASGEGSQELASSDTAAEKLFALLMEK
ncbi:MAG: tetratricopeptide repeat protein [Spirochaetota bacterium]|jgi:tetratricopeptide (TPR) repeat protein|nr:tetratricopeptide repeat protein [Spirochaetota bacterium]